MMMHRPYPARPMDQQWLDQVFDCRAAETGGVIRRQLRDVEREVGLPALTAEVRRRNFRLIRSRAHAIIICDPGPVERLV